MAEAKKKYMGGVRDVQTLRDRCHENERGCWVWLGCMSNGKQPCVTMNIDGKSRNFSGKRAAYFLGTGKWPQKQLVAVTGEDCDKCCVNPDHVRVTTKSARAKRTIDENFEAMQKAWRKAGMAGKARNAKLTDIQARAIYGDERGSEDISAEYNVSAAVVRQIKARKSWRTATAANSVFSWRPAA